MPAIGDFRTMISIPYRAPSGDARRVPRAPFTDSAPFPTQPRAPHTPSDESSHSPHRRATAAYLRARDSHIQPLPDVDTVNLMV